MNSLPLVRPVPISIYIYVLQIKKRSENLKDFHFLL